MKPMSKTQISSLIPVKVILWGTIFFSAEGLVYNVRWFIPFLNNHTTNVVPIGKMPLLWFLVQILENIIFLVVGGLLIRLVNKFRRTGFFDEESLKVLNGVILSCIALALLGAIQTIANNFYEVHFDQWTSLESIANRALRSFTRLLVLREPQTMYFLLAIILWAIRQFVSRALVIKSENEAIV
jgi:hypothetical protein